MLEQDGFVRTTMFVDRVLFVRNGMRSWIRVARYKCIARVAQQLGCEPDAVNRHVAVALLGVQWPDDCRKTMEFPVMTTSNAISGPIDTVMFGNYSCSLEQLQAKQYG